MQYIDSRIGKISMSPRDRFKLDRWPTLICMRCTRSVTGSHTTQVMVFIPEGIDVGDTWICCVLQINNKNVLKQQKHSSYINCVTRIERLIVEALTWCRPIYVIWLGKGFGQCRNWLIGPLDLRFREMERFAYQLMKLNKVWHIFNYVIGNVKYELVF